jgi:hypothetical protein
MKRRIPVMVASALAAATALAFSPGAHAAAKPVIRTYTEQGSVNFTGVGTNARYFFRTWGNEKVELRPRLAFNDNWHSKFRRDGVRTSAGQLAIGGNRRYTRIGGSRWAVKTLTANQLRTWAHELDPSVALAKFDALPGVRRLAARHYRVTGTYSKIGSFLAWEFTLPAASFSGSNIKIFTIDVWTDPAGRPVKISGSARSSKLSFSVTETFTNYNKPVTIKIP